MKYRKTNTHYGIDDGELAGLSRQKCFILGVEFELFKRRIDHHRETGCGITTTVHSQSEQRIGTLLADSGITYQRKWLNDDWVDIIIAPTDDCHAMRREQAHAPTSRLEAVLLCCLAVGMVGLGAAVATLYFSI